MARLPLFLYTLRASHSLLVDDGRQLIIGACVECGTLVCAGPGLARQGPVGWSSPVAAVMKVSGGFPFSLCDSSREGRPVIFCSSAGEEVVLILCDPFQ